MNVNKTFTIRSNFNFGKLSSGIQTVLKSIING